MTQRTDKGETSRVNFHSLIVVIETYLFSLITFQNYFVAKAFFEKRKTVLRYVYTLRLIRPISYLYACYIHTKVTK